eukprot:COSAG02_NODE_6681_length_3421_cov_52.109573_1_plen_144_part_00
MEEPEPEPELDPDPEPESDSEPESEPEPNEDAAATVLQAVVRSTLAQYDVSAYRNAREAIRRQNEILYIARNTPLPDELPEMRTACRELTVPPFVNADPPLLQGGFGDRFDTVCGYTQVAKKANGSVMPDPECPKSKVWCVDP